MDQENQKKRPKWDEYGMDKSLGFVEGIAKQEQERHNMLTSKAYQSLSIAGILVGLVFTGLTLIIDNDLLKEDWQQIVGISLGIIFSGSLIVSVVSAILAVKPRTFKITKLNDDFIGKITYKPNEKIVDKIMQAIESDVENNKPMLGEIANNVSWSWISLAISISIVALFTLFLII